MMTRILYTEIWSDFFFIELSIEEKLLFIYFLTNERVNIIHLYQCPNARIKADTGIDTPIIEKAKKTFAGRIYFKDGFVFLKNACKYESYRGPQNETAKAKLFARLSKSILDWYNNISDTPIDTPLIGTRNKKSEIRTHKQEIENKKYSEMIDPDTIPI